MRRFLIITVTALLLSVTAQAQSYQQSKYYNPQTHKLDYGYNGRNSGLGTGDMYYGLRLGPSFSTVNSDDKALDGGNSQTGLNLGAVVGIPLSDVTPLYAELGLFYNEKGGKSTYEGKKMTYDLNYLEAPFVVKYIYDVDGDFSVQPFVGGYLAMGISGKVKNYGDREASGSFSKRYFQRFDGGLRLGCGVAYDLFYADISYDIGLANICHDEFDTSHNGCLSINFGVNF